MEKLHVTVWNEFFHEKREESIAKIYPEGIHGAIAAFLGKEADLEVTTATLDMPEQHRRAHLVGTYGTRTGLR